MKKWYRHRILLFFLVFFLIGNSVMVSRVQATGAELGLTLAELTAGSGGAAAFGSAALGVAIPLLLAVGTVYAGYKVYQNRTAIQNAFYKWYSKADTTVTSAINAWCNTVSAGIANGSITDNSILKIPSGVLSAVKSFVTECEINYEGTGGTTLNTDVVYLSDLASKVTNESLRTLLLNSSKVSQAPVSIVTNKKTGEEAIYFSSSATARNTAVFYLYAGASSSVFRTQYIANDLFLTNTKTTDDLYYGNSYYKTVLQADGTYKTLYDVNSPNMFTLSAANININGNLASGDSWDYTVQWIIPKNAIMVVVNEPVSSVDGKATALNPYNYKIIGAGASSTVSNPYQKLDTTYTPTYVGNAEDQALEVTLTPEVVNKMNDYIVKGTADELDVVRTIDPSGIVAVPTPEEEDLTNEGLLEGVTDAIQTGVKGITDVIQGIGDFILTIPQVLADFWEKLWEWLQSILDAILSIPGLLVNTLQGILEWLFVPDAVAVEEFVDGLEGTISDRTGILTYPLSLVISFLNQVLSLSSGDCILVIPSITIDGYHLMNRYEFNFTQYVNQSDFAELYQIYRLITNFILILAVLNLAIKKGSEIIRGN